MIPAAVVAEIERRIRLGWTGKIALDFKDGHVNVGKETVARGEKPRD